MPISVWVFGGLLMLILAIGFFLSGSRDHFLKDWMPALIAGLFLAGIVPYANELYWKRQKDFEVCVYDREKRYELMASVTRTYTHLFKTHTRLNDSAKERSHEERLLRRLITQKKAPKDIVQAHISRLAALNAERSDLAKERGRLEGQIAADSALISRFYSQDIRERHAKLAMLYDKRTSEKKSFVPNPDDPIVKGAFQLAGLMAEEGKTNECK